MRVLRLVVVVLVLARLVSLFITPTWAKSNKEAVAHAQQLELNNQVRGFLESKKSPLAPETDYLLTQKHWKLLIAISAIESQYCTKQLGLNCWGITKFEGGYRRYASIREGIKDANDLIERWQAKGKWLTPEEMNCVYVVPCNQNWVNVVNRVTKQLTSYERSTEHPVATSAR